MSRAQILIVGGADDPHIARVRAELNARAAPSVVLDPFGDPPTPVALRPGRHPRLEVISETGPVSLEHVRAVWWRVKPRLAQLRGVPADDGLTGQFIEREWQHLLEPLEGVLASARWMNPRRVDRRARHKPSQLLDAAAAGFPVPDTLISNDPVAIRVFLEEAEGATIYKTLSWYFCPPDRLAFTTGLSPDVADEHRGALEVAPGIFQRRVPKCYELRITIVGYEVFAVLIDSQARAQTSLDWRRDPYGVDVGACELPRDFSERLLAYHRSVGLVFGAYDFVVTPEQEYVFLEVNPAGQWLWLEERADVQISASIARLLATWSREDEPYDRLDEADSTDRRIGH